MREPQDTQMSLGDHLEELRKRIIKSLLGVTVILGLTIYYGDVILLWLCQPLYDAQRDAGLPAQAFGFGVGTGFAVWTKVTLISAVIIAAPWIIFQGWRFIEAGLYARERRAAMIVAPFSGLMTLLGVLFSYYIMVPLCLGFLLAFTVSMPPAPVEGFRLMPWLSRQVQRLVNHEPQLPIAPPPAIPADKLIQRVPVRDADPTNPAEGDIWVNRKRGELRLFLDQRVYAVTLSTSTALAPLIEIGDYVSFVLFMTFGVVLAFQVPPLMLIAGWSGLINPVWAAKYRTYCIFGCFIVGAIVTPGDGVSMFVLALPLWGLFELGLLLMRMTWKPRPPEAEE